METPYILVCPKCSIEFMSPNGRKGKLCPKCHNFYFKGIGYPKIFYKNRKIVFERDEKKCQCCGCSADGKITNTLCVHHLDCDRGNNSLSNLITLCFQCHLSLHRKYPKTILRRSNIYKLFANEQNFGEFGKNNIYEPAKKIVKKQFGGKPKLFFGSKKYNKKLLVKNKNYGNDTGNNQ